MRLSLSLSPEPGKRSVNVYQMSSVSMSVLTCSLVEWTLLNEHCEIQFFSDFVGKSWMFVQD